MTHPRLRRLLTASVTAAALVLAGCAVPGQEGAPGVAAQYDGRTVTNERVNEVHQAWVTDTEGVSVPSQRRSIITIEVIGPRAIAAAEEAGFPISDSEATAFAEQWIDAAEVDREPSPALVETVHAIFAIAVLAVLGSEDDFTILREIVAEVESEAVFSPRAGEFSSDLFFQSINDSIDQAISQQLGPLFFTPFLNVNGLAEPAAPWIDRG